MLLPPLACSRLTPQQRSWSLRHRRWLVSLSALALLLSSQGCGPRSGPGATAPSEARRQQQQRAEQQALARCQQQRRELLDGLAELRQAETSLAELRATVEAAAADPRPIWDEQQEERFSQVDQQLDRQRYEQELAAWQQRQAGRERPDRAALANAQERLNRLSRQLHQRYPSLFTAPQSIELNPQELERLSRCTRAAV